MNQLGHGYHSDDLSPAHGVLHKGQQLVTDSLGDWAPKPLRQGFRWYRYHSDNLKPAIMLLLESQKLPDGATQSPAQKSRVRPLRVAGKTNRLPVPLDHFQLGT